MAVGTRMQAARKGQISHDCRLDRSNIIIAELSTYISTARLRKLTPREYFPGLCDLSNGK